MAGIGIFNLKRWERFQYEREGEVISYEVKRLNPLDAAPFLAAMAVAQGRIAECYTEIQNLYDALPPRPAAPAGQPEDPGEQAPPEDRQAYRVAYEAWSAANPEYVPALRASTLALQKFTCRQSELLAKVSEMVPRDLVLLAFDKYVRNVEGLVLDGVEETSGAALLEIADQRLMTDVLGHVRELAEMGGARGKAFASPSTSSPAAETSGSSSAATSTGGEAGTEP